MRITIILLCVALLSGCATSQRSQTAQNTNSQAGRLDPRAANRSVAPTSPVLSKPTVDEWRVISIKGRFLSKDTSTIRVYLNTTVRKGERKATVSDFTTQFMLNYVIYPDYNNRDRLGYGNVPLKPESVMQEGDMLTIFFDIKKPANPNLTAAIMLLEITQVDNGRKAQYDLPLRLKATKLSDRFALFDPKTGLPQLRNYATVNDTIVIRDVAGTSKPLRLLRYKHDFDPAQSPMNTAPRSAPKTLDVDSTMTIMTNQPFRLPQEGLYFFLEDTVNTFGIGLVVSDKRFPKLTRPEKLIKPVMYMSTNSEIGELTRASDAKKAFDRYWLNLMSGDQNVARKAIRLYYDRVEEANRLFTTYKEGWKTDKGMIYVVLGAPDRVQRSRDREVWVYNQRSNVSEINFTFNRKQNQFVEDHYELVRYVEYQPIWYPVVEAWRTGAIRE